MKRLLAILPALAIACAACKGNDTAPTSTSSTKTDTFTGTVQVKSSDVHNFTVAASGTIQITLTAASPPSTIVMGVGIGTPGDNACGIVSGGSVTTSAGSIAQLTGVASPGTLCVSVFDVGNQTAPVTYTVTVVHP